MDNEWFTESPPRAQIRRSHYPGARNSLPSSCRRPKTPSYDYRYPLSDRKAIKIQRSVIPAKIHQIVNSDIPAPRFLYGSGLSGSGVNRSKSRIDRGAAWIDENIKLSMAAYEIEKNAPVSFDCPDPGNTEDVKAVILGAWEGKDDLGAAIKFTFRENNTVVGRRKGREAGTKKYIICGRDVHWTTKSGANLVATVQEDKTSLEGKWHYGELSGVFAVEPCKE